MVNKEEDDWTKEEREKLNRNLKAKIITTIALGIDEFLCVSHWETIKKCGTPFKLSMKVQLR